MAENIYNDEEPESSPADIGMKIKRPFSKFKSYYCLCFRSDPGLFRTKKVKGAQMNFFEKILSTRAVLCTGTYLT